MRPHILDLKMTTKIFPMLRMIIADDHTVVRLGIKQILTNAFPFAHIEEVTDAEDLLKKVIRENWDLVISDISMPGRSGLEILQQIRKTHPKLPILILTMYSEDHYGLRVMKAGASGYLNKEMAASELITAVNRVLSGKKYITPSIAEQMAASFDKHADKLPHEKLSDREFEVFKLIADGLAVSQVAEKLCLSVTTVSTYRSRILDKMSFKSNADLTRYAMEQKLL